MEGLRLPKWGVGGILLRSERTPQSCVSAPLVIFMLNGNPVCLASIREYLLFFNDTSLFIVTENNLTLWVGSSTQLLLCIIIFILFHISLTPLEN